MSGDSSDILLRRLISFIDICSSSLIFVIPLCSSAILFELDSGSIVSCETPKSLGFELRKRKRRDHCFAFFVVIRA